MSEKSPKPAARIINDTNPPLTIGFHNETGHSLLKTRPSSYTHPDHGIIHGASFDELEAVWGLEMGDAVKELARLDGILSSPAPTSSFDDLSAQFPSLDSFGMGFVSDDGHAHIIFDQLGREVQLSYYKKTNKFQPVEFATYERYITHYDNDGYITQETHMSPFPEYPGMSHGFRHTMIYNHLPKGKRRIRMVEIQPVGKRGIIDPGDPIGKPHALDFRLVNRSL